MSINNNISINPNYDLPPIRKIGPAVLPKPKNIKIQAGRVIRFNEFDNSHLYNNSASFESELVMNGFNYGFESFFLLYFLNKYILKHVFSP